jgi:hypothetical protein
MHIASDYIHPHKDSGGRPSHCRACIYLPDDVLHAPVVVCSEVRAAENHLRLCLPLQVQETSLGVTPVRRSLPR